MDPDDRGQGYHKLLDANITVELFPPDLVAEIQELNRRFIESRKQLKSKRNILPQINLETSSRNNNLDANSRNVESIVRHEQRTSATAETTVKLDNPELLSKATDLKKAPRQIRDNATKNKRSKRRRANLFRNILITDALDPEVERRYWHDLERAKELWTSGLNLRRILTDHQEVLERILDRKGSLIRVILLDPSAARYGAIQEFGVEGDAKGCATSIRGARKRLCAIRTGRPGSIEIRKVNYPFGFAVDLINPATTADGIAYIRYYPIRNRRVDTMNSKKIKRQTLEDQPILRLVATKPGHRRLFKLYKQQFITLWKEEELGEDWSCPSINSSRVVR
jgi:hypothetical protein